MPGKEIAYSVIREEGYEEGRNPTMASVASALMQKYGAVPTRVQETPLVQVFNWTYAPDGGLMPPDSSLASRCGASSDPNGCGIAVAATITSMRTNPDLAQSIQVGVLDQGGGYSLLDATQVGLEELDAQRRAKAVEEASRNADKPTL